jgi:hypothetical protein
LFPLFAFFNQDKFIKFLTSIHRDTPTTFYQTIDKF